MTNYAWRSFRPLPGHSPSPSLALGFPLQCTRAWRHLQLPEVTMRGVVWINTWQYHIVLVHARCSTSAYVRVWRAQWRRDSRCLHSSTLVPEYDRFTVEKRRWANGQTTVWPSPFKRCAIPTVWKVLFDAYCT